jgi:hypothetical protein
MQRSSIGVVPLALLVLLGTASLATAQAARGACQDDVARFCGDAAGDRRAVRDCLREHQEELSQQCKDRIAHMGRMHGRGGGRFSACRADVQKLCGDTGPGKESIRDCLREHEDELSDGCRTRLSDRPPG